jgi:hypothetical protein
MTVDTGRLRHSAQKFPVDPFGLPKMKIYRNDVIALVDELDAARLVVAAVGDLVALVGTEGRLAAATKEWGRLIAALNTFEEVAKEGT